MSFKKPKKSLQPFRHLALGIPSHIGLAPLGFSAELDKGVEFEGGTGNGKRFRVVSRESQSQVSPSLPGASTSAPGDFDDSSREHEQESKQKVGNIPKGKRGHDILGLPLAVERDHNLLEREDRETTAECPTNIPLGHASEDDAANFGKPEGEVLENDLENPRPGGTIVPASVANEGTPGFGTLKAILQEIPEETVPTRNKIDNLVSRVDELEKHFYSKPSDVPDQRRRGELMSKLGSIERRLRLSCGGPEPQRVVDDIRGDGIVFKLLEDLQEAMFDYQMVRQTEVYNQECKLMNPDEAVALNGFRCAQGAEFRHGERRGCLKGTREVVLDEIEFWARDFTEPPVYWLNGLAGTGKTTIAQTIAERAFADGRLGASFFCSRYFEDRSDLHFIFPTLAVQLARRYRAFRSHLVPLVRSDPGIAHESLNSQIFKLIVQPLKKANIPTVIIIDALDECKDNESASAILSVLGRSVSKIPKVKFFVTGRPEPRILEGFRLPLLAEATDVFILHEVEPIQVDSDIRLFFTHMLLGLARRRRGLDDWPTNEQLDLLCERAAGLFIYAMITVKFIEKQSANPRKQLDLLLESPESSAREAKTKFGPNVTLDSLYMSVLLEAFGDDDDPDNDPTIRSVLGVMALAVNPLSPSTIARLLRLDLEDVYPLLSSARSLLIFHEDADSPVRPFHKSFSDFVTDPDRCTNKRFYVSPPDHHSQFLVDCLDLMDQTLVKNMCRLPDGVANSDVWDLKQRIDQYVDPALQYTCRSWHAHLTDRLAGSVHIPKITYSVRRFLEKKFLFWLEVLSVLGAAKNAVNALRIVVDLLEDSSTLELANDCSRFVTAHFEIIRVSSPHIYHSALAFSPKTSIVRALYESHAKPFVRIIHGVPASWDSSIATIPCPFTIGVAVWSSCNGFIAVGSRDAMIVDILDSGTLQRLQRLGSLRAMSTRPRALAFSPDNRTLTCSAWTTLPQLPRAPVISWDLQTGGILSSIGWEVPEGSTTTRPHITHSKSGEMVGILYQYSTATVVSIFNVTFGTYMHDAYHQAHEDSDSLTDQRAYTIWTHGDYLRFATAEPTTITIWEVGFTSGVPCTKVETLSFPDNVQPRFVLGQGGLDHISFPQFHPTSRRLAVVHDGPVPGVLVWDAQNSKALLRFAGVDFNPRSTFSSSGHFFACPTGGSEVYLWKEFPAGYTLHGRLTCSAAIPTPLFSPNGELIITYGTIGVGNSTVQLWHTKNPTATPSSIQLGGSRNTRDFVLDFLPDRKLAAVARQKGDVVTVIDLTSGLPKLTIDTSMAIYGLRAIVNTVVAIGDGKIATWDISEGVLPLDARMSIGDCALTMAFDGPSHSRNANLMVTSISPDYRHVAFVTLEFLGYQYLHIRNTYTGQCVSGVGAEGEGHFLYRPGVVGNTLWFSLDGHSIWCAVDTDQAGVWTITNQGNLDCTVSAASLEEVPRECPWVSSCGYQVTDDGWIQDPDGTKRLLMLPSSWQGDAIRRVWSGQFLALLHGQLFEPVIMELEP